MKHVLMVIPTLRMGGAEKSIVSLLKSLDPKRVQVDLYLFEAGGELQKELPEWVKVLEADPVTRGMTLEIRYHLGGMLCRGHVLAVLARLWMTLSAKLRQKLRLEPAFSWKLAKRFIPPLEKHYDAAVGYLEGFADFFVLDKVQADRKIGWIHIDMTKRVPAPQEMQYYEQFDSIATISDICLNAFVGHFPSVRDKIQIVENIVLKQEVWSKAEAETVSGWDQTKVHLVTVGRLDYQKGIDVGARACKVLKDRGVSVCWHIYGQGVMRDEIQQYVERHGLQEMFILEGMKPNPYPYMKHSDLIVQPSRWEGKSIVLDEAKILGKAIVVTNYASVEDQIQNGVTGLVTGMEPEEIADGIQKLLENSALKTSLEANCLKEPNRSIRAVETFYEMVGA